MTHTVFQAPGYNASVLMLAKTSHVGWSLHGICFAASSLSIRENSLLLDWDRCAVLSVTWFLIAGGKFECVSDVLCPYSIVALDALFHDSLSYITAQRQICFRVSIFKLAVGVAPQQSLARVIQRFTLRTKLTVLVPEDLLLRSRFASYTVIRKSVAFRPCANDNMAIYSK